LQFTRSTFTNGAAEVINEFSITGEQVDVKASLVAYTGGKTPRDVFKRFYKDVGFQSIVASVTRSPNPWKHWIENNPDAVNDFLKKFELAIRGVMADGYAVDVSKLAALKVNLKRT